MKITKQVMIDSKIQVHGAGEMVSLTYAIAVIEELEDALRMIQAFEGYVPMIL